jgi:aminoglycoside phosphotransferase (APT) family kinase protein
VTPLANPERRWTHEVAAVDRAEVETRLGPTSEPVTLLAGGLVNRNLRVGRDRVLRIVREPSLLALERALLSRAWRTFRTPAVLASGDDFLVLEYLEHGPLADAAETGAAVGRALAEIHAVRYPRTGWLGPDLSVARPFPGDGSGGFTPRGYGQSELAHVRSFLGAELSARVDRFLEEEPLAARNVVDVPVLAHCDFKASNLHWTARGELLVLDWEFAWAGSRYIDLGQIMRWHPSEAFARAFADSYVDGGGLLADDWRRFAEVVDLCALLGLYRNPAARSTDDVVRRIVEIIER